MTGNHFFAVGVGLLFQKFLWIPSFPFFASVERLRLSMVERGGGWKPTLRLRFADDVVPSAQTDHGFREGLTCTRLESPLP